MAERPLRKDYYAHPNKFIENNTKLPYLNQSYTLPKKCINKYRELDREVGRKTTYLYKDINKNRSNYTRKCMEKHSADSNYYLFHKKIYVYKKGFTRTFLKAWYFSGKVHIFEHWYDEQFI